MIGQMASEMPAISNPQQQFFSEMIKTATAVNEQLKAAGAEVAKQLLFGAKALELAFGKIPGTSTSGGGIHLPQAGGYITGGAKP
jgi:hypothetical protein